jgi:hypothetical protein
MTERARNASASLEVEANKGCNAIVSPVSKVRCVTAGPAGTVDLVLNMTLLHFVGPWQDCGAEQLQGSYIISTVAGSELTFLKQSGRCGSSGASASIAESAAVLC